MATPTGVVDGGSPGLVVAVVSGLRVRPHTPVTLGWGCPVDPVPTQVTVADVVLREGRLVGGVAVVVAPPESVDGDVPAVTPTRRAPSPVGDVTGPQTTHRRHLTEDEPEERPDTSERSLHWVRVFPNRRTLSGVRLTPCPYDFSVPRSLGSHSRASGPREDSTKTTTSVVWRGREMRRVILFRCRFPVPSTRIDVGRVG